MATISNADNLPNLAILKQITTVPGAAYGRNALINGDFQVNQRYGTTAMLSSSSLYNYYHDRWQTPSNGFWNYAPAGSAGPYGSPGVRMYRTSGSTNQSQGLYYQTLSQNQSRGYQGKFVTLSFWVRVGSAYTGTTAATSAVVASLHYGTGATEVSQPATGFTGLTNFQITNPSTLTTTLQFVSYTTSAVIPTTMTQMAIRLIGNGSATAATANDYIEFFDVQLEEGTAATPYQRKTWEQSMVDCYAYWWSTYPYGTRPATANAANYMLYAGVASTPVNNVVGQYRFPVAMHKVPTMSLYSVVGATANVLSYYATSGSLTLSDGGAGSGTLANNGVSNTLFIIVNGGSSAFGSQTMFVAQHAVADAELNT